MCLTEYKGNLTLLKKTQNILGISTSKQITCDLLPIQKSLFWAAITDTSPIKLLEEKDNTLNYSFDLLTPAYLESNKHTMRRQNSLYNTVRMVQIATPTTTSWLALNVNTGASM